MTSSSKASLKSATRRILASALLLPYRLGPQAWSLIGSRAARRMAGKMQINVDAQIVKEEVVAAISKKKPFSLLRMGDGEVLVYDYHNQRAEKVARKLNDHRISHNCASIEELKRHLDSAILDADILGLPHKQRQKEHQLYSLIPKIYGSVFVRHGEDWKDRRYCSIGVHTELLKTGIIFDVLSQTEKLMIISPRDLEASFAARFPQLREIDQVNLPGQRKYEENDTDVRMLFPDVFDSVVHAIGSKNRSGWLCLFGGGVSGKAFGSVFKQAGGVAVDLGSVFDKWAGKVTRGRGAGSHSYDDEYRL